MSFLSSVVGYVLTAILSAVGGWLLKVIHLWYTNMQQDKQAEHDAQQSDQPLKDADPKDGKAIDDASNGALGGF